MEKKPFCLWKHVVTVVSTLIVIYLSKGACCHAAPAPSTLCTYCHVFDFPTIPIHLFEILFPILKSKSSAAAVAALSSVASNSESDN